MTTMISEVYEAFKEANVSDATARKAAEAVAAYGVRLASLDVKTAEVQREAARLVEQQRKQEQTAAFVEECNRVNREGQTQFGERAFAEAMKDLWEACGRFDEDIVEAAMEAGKPGQVLFKLSQDPNEAERIGKLPASRKGAAVAKFAGTLEAAASAAEVTRAPPPIAFLRRGGGNSEPRIERIDGRLTIIQWMLAALIGGIVSLILKGFG